MTEPRQPRSAHLCAAALAIVGWLGPGVAFAFPLDARDFVSLGTATTSAPAWIDTTTLTFTDGVTTWTGVDHDGVAVFAFDDLTLGAWVSAYGVRPLALLARGDLVLSSVLDASGYGAYPGPGGHGGTWDLRGGGPGGGYSGASGGFGGAGGWAAEDWSQPYGDLQVRLEGGSSGGSSGGWYTSGAGGGAVELGAGSTLTLLPGSEIRAMGGEANNYIGYVFYFAGAGSGGGIFLHAPRVDCGGRLDARGGPEGRDWGSTGGGGRVDVLGAQVAACVVDVSPGSADYGSDRGQAGVVTTEPTDADGDGLAVWEEAALGTSDLDPDTDGGGALDAAEVRDGTDALDGSDDLVVIEQLTPGTAGVENRLVVSGATARSQVLMAGAVAVGPTAVPGCPGLSLALGAPGGWTTAVADDLGLVDVRWTPPAGLAGRTAAVQVVDLATCRASRPVVGPL